MHSFREAYADISQFYRPWDLRDDEEDRKILFLENIFRDLSDNTIVAGIEDQVKDVQNLIDKEVAEFSARQGQKSAEHNGNEGGPLGVCKCLSRR